MQSLPLTALMSLIPISWPSNRGAASMLTALGEGLRAALITVAAVPAVAIMCVVAALIDEGEVAI